MDIATGIVIGLALLLMVWYAVGGILNSHRMQVLASGVREALTQTARPATARRLGRNEIRFEAEHPVRGVDRVHATLLLAPRESLLAWILWMLQGRGDLLDIRVDLADPPIGAGLIADPRHPTGRAALRAAVAAGGTRRDGAPGAVSLAAYDAQGLATMGQLAPLPTDLGQVVLLELRGARPQVTVLVALRRDLGFLAGLRPALGRLASRVTRAS